MLLSDRDIRAEIEAGRVGLDPYDPTLVQPSSIDIRMDRYFRVFENHRYPHIDPAEEQPDLTRQVEPDGDEPFILHPGEFVLGSSYEGITLPDDIAARLEGKALALDTPIPTPAGWRTMGDLGVGDEVFDETGQPCAVVAATGVMVDRPCREVHFSDGTVLVADVAHQWYTVTKAERAHGRRPGRIRTTGEIAESLRRGDEWRHHVPLAGQVQYPEQDLPIAPYVLGVWLGDGTKTKAEITCAPQDCDVLREIESSGYAVWKSSGRSVLGSLGLLGNKHVPETYLRASVRQRIALLQGLMDSDGYVDTYGRCEFMNKQEHIADAVLLLAASLGLRPVKSKKRATLNGIDHGPVFRIKFTPRLPVFRLKCKLNRVKIDSRRHAFRAIIAVREISSVPLRCIEVSSSSGLFLAGPTYIPTHNSSLGRLGLLTHSTAGFIDPGFSGHVTLELSNVATLPIKLWPGMKIGQLCFFRLSSPSEHPYGSEVYGSRYQGQRGPTASRSHRNFFRTRL